MDKQETFLSDVYTKLDKAECQVQEGKVYDADKHLENLRATVAAIKEVKQMKSNPSSENSYTDAKQLIAEILADDK